MSLVDALAYAMAWWRTERPRDVDVAGIDRGLWRAGVFYEPWQLAYRAGGSRARARERHRLSWGDSRSEFRGVDVARRRLRWMGYALVIAELKCSLPIDDVELVARDAEQLARPDLAEMVRDSRWDRVVGGLRG